MEQVWPQSRLKFKLATRHYKAPRSEAHTGTAVWEQRAYSSERRTVWFGKGRLETQVKLCAGRLLHFIITGSSRQLLEEEVKPVIQRFLTERGLTLSPDKTRVTHIDQGFDFLGQNLRKYKGKLLIKPARKSIKALLRKVRGVVKANAQATAGHLILQLNPILRGWANYHRHGVSKATFGRVAYWISDIIWRWAVRRHPRKSKTWIKQKYFHTAGDRNRVFFGQIEGRDNQSHQIDLFDVAGVPIKRHIKIRNTANPYDPQWRDYFEQRQTRQLA
jgi:RNA-directed DNA polymerase